MQIMPHICSELGLLMMKIFRYVLYCLMLLIYEYFSNHFYVVYLFCNVFMLELFADF